MAVSLACAKHRLWESRINNSKGDSQLPPKLRSVRETSYTNLFDPHCDIGSHGCLLFISNKSLVLTYLSIPLGLFKSCC